MNFLVWLEGTWWSGIVRESVWGYAAMITLHSLGLAIIVGLSVVLSLRILGLFGVIPFSSLHRLLKLAWVGFIVNFLSGASLFMYQGTTYIVKGIFLTKMVMVILGAILVAVMQGRIKAAPSGGGEIDDASSSLKITAWATIVTWSIALTAGRFIAYL